MYWNTDYYTYYDYNRAIIIAYFLLFREKWDHPKSNNYSKWSYFTEKICTSDIIGWKQDIFYHISNLISLELIDYITVYSTKGIPSIFRSLDEVNTMREKYQQSLEEIEILTWDIIKEKLSIHISSYIDYWQNTDGLPTYWNKNFLEHKEQIKALKLILQDKFRINKSTQVSIAKNEVWGKIVQDNNAESTVDIIGCLLYLESKRQVKITDIDINDTVRFYLEIAPILLQNIYFNTVTWKVYENEKEIWEIPINTQQFFLFQFLYNNAWKFKSHQDIKENIAPWVKSMWETAQWFVANKKRLLSPEIKNLISSPKWWYKLNVIT